MGNGSSSVQQAAGQDDNAVFSLSNELQGACVLTEIYSVGFHLHFPFDLPILKFTATILLWIIQQRS